ncbi:hypothetical protein [Listeria cornellensis]|uniref:Uncharacterized protein n=1 Tax=Listeria cornellensis FSL F6-0969 TaxID=1265820 RepID=W7C5Y2_9LIST|nr:hypothetical protein [Listeria cornellensis]EUJ31061.1 hypothetical protein PCORN_06155 [Listeria cornellensis FSL F6-0969]
MWYVSIGTELLTTKMGICRRAESSNFFIRWGGKLVSRIVYVLPAPRFLFVKFKLILGVFTVKLKKV